MAIMMGYNFLYLINYVIITMNLIMFHFLTTLFYVNVHKFSDIFNYSLLRYISLGNLYNFICKSINPKCRCCFMDIILDPATYLAQATSRLFVELYLVYFW